MTREEALRRLRASRERKKAFVSEMERMLRNDYKQRTGQEAMSFTEM